MNSSPQTTRNGHIATAPNQVWSWDITKLKGPVPYLYYSLYVILRPLQPLRRGLDGCRPPSAAALTSASARSTW